MATIKLPKELVSLSITDIWCHVGCAECGHTYSCQMTRPVTRKNCHCGEGTFVFEIRPSAGKLDITVQFIGADLTPGDYPLSRDQIEFVTQ